MLKVFIKYYQVSDFILCFLKVKNSAYNIDNTISTVNYKTGINITYV
ncbi:hypothetical protein [Alkaliphilus hydrothermalis]|uniref:Uncharacterized protein n=1 Tax=Alkaliphilus hydrothermalis TaxID=1482730 RepID=A0ABS2NRA2_9FIRM|nr:hypothetical protein [Alkaliphilus hydrothermalis]MBM7615099.1 hypothetical protein [Alkaliphilus hydrothermalis]